MNKKNLDDVINHAIETACVFHSEIEPLCWTGRSYVIEELVRLLVETAEYDDALELARHIEDLPRLIRSYVNANEDDGG